MAAAPALENFHGRREKLLCDAAIPIFRLDRERTEKSEASPIGREVRADQLSRVLCRENCGRVCLPTRARILGIAHETRRLRYAQESAKCEADDAIDFGKFAFDERPDQDVRLKLRRGHTNIKTLKSVAGKLARKPSSVAPERPRALEFPLR